MSSVYLPDNDSYFFIDFLELHKQNYLDNNNLVFLEVGCGSGVISRHISHSYYKKNKFHPLILSSDINPRATAYSKKKLRESPVVVDSVNDCITTGLIDGIDLSRVDLLLFNTPYVKCEGCVYCKNDTSNLEEYYALASVCGSENGNSTLYALLYKIVDLRGNQKINMNICLLFLVQEYDLLVGFIRKEFKTNLLISKRKEIKKGGEHLIICEINLIM